MREIRSDTDNQIAIQRVWVKFKNTFKSVGGVSASLAPVLTLVSISSVSVQNQGCSSDSFLVWSRGRDVIVEDMYTMNSFD
jgi:hypothetical protein